MLILFWIWRYRKLIDGWKEARPPPRTPEEATRLVILILKGHKKEDVEVFMYFQTSIPLNLFKSTITVWYDITETYLITDELCFVVWFIGIVDFLWSSTVTYSSWSSCSTSYIFTSRSTIWNTHLAGKNQITIMSVLLNGGYNVAEFEQTTIRWYYI